MTDLLSFTPFLLVIAITIAAIYKFLSFRTSQSTDYGDKVSRSLYFYVISFITLGMTTFGIILLIQSLLENTFSQTIVSAPNEMIALGLSLSLVGLPIWVFHWRIVSKELKKDISTKNTTINAVYTYLVLSISISILINSGYSVLTALIGDKEHAWYQVSSLLVLSAVWIYHWKLSLTNKGLTQNIILIKQIYTYGTSFISLMILSFAFSGLLHSLTQLIYDSLFDNSLTINSGENREFIAGRRFISILIPSLLAWIVHWLLIATKEESNRVKTLYLYTATIVAGGITSLIAISSLLHGILSIIIGTDIPENEGRIDQAPGAISALIVGLSLLYYHQKLIFENSEKGNGIFGTSRELRLFGYAFSIIALLILAPGISSISQTILNTISQPFEFVESSTESWKDNFVSGLTMVLIGSTLWISCRKYIINRIEITNSYNDSLPKIYFNVVFGIGIFVAVPALSTLIFFILRDILAGEIGIETVRSSRLSISTLISFAFIVPYHYWLYRNNLPKTPYNQTNRAKIRKQVMLFAPPNSSFFIAELEETLGYEINSVSWMDSGSSNINLDNANTPELCLAIEGAIGKNVVVIPEASGVRVYSYN